MSGNYKGGEGALAQRRGAIEAAKELLSHEYDSLTSRVAAAREVLGYGVFTAAQVGRWFSVQRTYLAGLGCSEEWGAGTLKPEQFDIAIELAEAGVAGERPKTTIYQARTEHGLSYDLIGGLLGVHKNICLRIVARVEGRPWT